ncbi:hypothetical protein B0O80DRAFT_81802 [Mortierella sp. GBAus27b]|nr:hypothetical protein BGX31_003883 [Mortierella sp. GBA43]KAI8352723.1 hypothetical protein B0O80DRAFT_81802 [Mortierella sp. GBAus27b]
MKRYSKIILSVVAIVALIGSTSVINTEAAPIANGVGVKNLAAGYEFEAAMVDNAVHLNKRQVVHTSGGGILPTGTKGGADPKPSPHDPPAATKDPKDPPTQTKDPNPTKDPALPKDTALPKDPKDSSAAPKPTAAKPTAVPTTAARGGVTGSAHPTGSSSAQSPSNSGASSSPDSSNGDDVPTGVSKTVFIGLGVVGGILVFALGGLAFCRHRKKKNLASALLQQTAQFNNNNPYAKLPDPPSPKGPAPVTSEKPPGTYTVITTYIPNLSDEIEMVAGDSATIEHEYDDGWCKGVNNSKNTEGIFPRHCVSMGPYEGSQHGAPGGPHFPPSPNPQFKAAANKRVSSIAPGGWGGFQHPPEPSPQYHGQGGGYYQGGRF